MGWDGAMSCPRFEALEGVIVVDATGLARGHTSARSRRGTRFGSRGGRGERMEREPGRNRGLRGRYAAPEARSEWSVSVGVSRGESGPLVAARRSPDLLTYPPCVHRAAQA